MHPPPSRRSRVSPPVDHPRLWGISDGLPSTLVPPSRTSHLHSRWIPVLTTVSVMSFFSFSLSMEPKRGGGGREGRKVTDLVGPSVSRSLGPFASRDTISCFRVFPSLNEALLFRQLVSANNQHTGTPSINWSQRNRRRRFFTSTYYHHERSVPVTLLIYVIMHNV